MSPEQTIWMLSILGALLFVAVGFLSARAVQVRAGPSDARARERRAEPRELRELRDLRSANEAALEEARALDQQLRAVVDERERLRMRLVAKELELAESVRIASELKTNVDSPAPEPAPPAPAPAPAPIVVPDPEAERAVRELEATVAELEERLARHREESASLREEKAGLVLALEDAERRAQEALAAEELERRTADLDLELAAARAKVADLDRLREENTRLRAQATDHAVLRGEVKRLEEERTKLLAQAFAHPVEQARELPAAPTTPGSFEKIVHEIARTTSVRAVAIADELGFTIAGIGSEQEGLAALSGLLGEIERRAQLLLPVGSVRRITLEMDHGAGVSVCPIARSDTRISLATLTVGPRPDTVSLTGAIEKAEELLFR